MQMLFQLEPGIAVFGRSSLEGFVEAGPLVDATILAGKEDVFLPVVDAPVVPLKLSLSVVVLLPTLLQVQVV